jgi:four helix bundle protein
MSPEILKNRTFDFAINVMRMIDELLSCKSHDVVSYQLIKSSTSVGANYRAACKAKSPADFVNKLKIVEEEADESEYWLDLLKAYGKGKTKSVETLLKEANELNRIFSASARTAKSNNKMKLK